MLGSYQPMNELTICRALSIAVSNSVSCTDFVERIFRNSAICRYLLEGETAG
jgi:hypothetical protein